MDVDGEPSASKPTFTPPGSLPRVEELPVEQSELRDIDFDLLEQQQFGSQQLDDTARESWADQQDQPQGLNPNVDLIDLGDGAASGAPAEVDPEPIVEGRPNYNIFHGESPPRLIETKQEEVASGDAFGAPAVQPSFAKKEEQAEEPAQVDLPLGLWTTTRTTLNPKKQHLKKVLLQAHHPLVLWRKVFNEFVVGEHGAEKTKRKSLSRGNFIKSVFHQPIAG